jgi:hypothetical protein
MTLPVNFAKLKEELTLMLLKLLHGIERAGTPSKHIL